MTAERLFLFAAIGFALALVVFLILDRLDARTIENVGVWAKPSKFALATAIHYGTFALVLAYLKGEPVTSAWLMVLALASVSFAIFEVGYIAIQAGRGEASHFNLSTPFYAAMYSLMAFGAVMVLAPAPVIGSIAAIGGSVLKDPVRLAIVLGLWGGTILTLVTAFRLGGNGGHFVGEHPPDGRLMPVTHWSLAVGDLRPAHFFATHMMQAVPIFAVVATRFAAPLLAGAAVLLFAAFWVGLCVFVFRQALAGRPLPF